MKIFKYSLKFDEDQEAKVELPKGAKILKVHSQKDEHGYKNNIMLWAAVDDEVIEEEDVYFELIGTGWEFPAEKLHLYVDTVFCDRFVWHIFRKVY